MLLWWNIVADSAGLCHTFCLGLSKIPVKTIWGSKLPSYGLSFAFVPPPRFYFNNPLLNTV
jgi:hypothetical protein